MIVTEGRVTRVGKKTSVSEKAGRGGQCQNRSCRKGGAKTAAKTTLRVRHIGFEKKNRGMKKRAQAYKRGKEREFEGETATRDGMREATKQHWV